MFFPLIPIQFLRHPIHFPGIPIPFPWDFLSVFSHYLSWNSHLFSREFPYYFFGILILVFPGNSHACFPGIAISFFPNSIPLFLGILCRFPEIPIPVFPGIPIPVFL